MPPQLQTVSEAKARRDLRRGIDQLATLDPHVAEWLPRIGYPKPRARPIGFVGFARAIVAQQVSVAAATGIWNKLEAGLGAMEPIRVIETPDDGLRTMGLSRQKASYIRGLAEAVVSGTLNFDDLHAAEDEAAIATITQLKGLGRWSAEIYLLFAMRRPDIWPGNDLALQEAMRILKKLRSRPDEKRLRKLGEAWRPHRSAGALFLWHVYHHAKGA
jgi:DNA-3-methyladenine glycosylase II